MLWHRWHGKASTMAVDHQHFGLVLVSEPSSLNARTGYLVDNDIFLDGFLKLAVGIDRVSEEPTVMVG